MIGLSALAFVGWFRPSGLLDFYARENPKRSPYMVRLDSYTSRADQVNRAPFTPELRRLIAETVTNLPPRVVTICPGIVPPQRTVPSCRKSQLGLNTRLTASARVAGGWCQKRLEFGGCLRMTCRPLLKRQRIAA